MLNPSTIIIIASSLLFALSGCGDLNGNRICVRELSAENPSTQETLVDVSHGVPPKGVSWTAADLVIRNAKVVTIDKDNPRAQAVAFKGQTIIAVTSNKAIEKYIKEGLTEIIDVQTPSTERMKDV
jgi:hypothetical protein